MKRIVRSPYPFPDLLYLAGGLNQLRKGRWEKQEDKRLREAWVRVEEIVIGVVRETIPRKGRTILREMLTGVHDLSLENAQRNFHWLAKQYPAQLSIKLIRTPKGHKGHDVPTPLLVAHEPASSGDFLHLRILWECFFGNQGYERLKPCQRCGDWFVDCGRNKRAVYCSEVCGNRWWSRSQRRAASHTQYK